MTTQYSSCPVRVPLVAFSITLAASLFTPVSQLTIRSDEPVKTATHEPAPTGQQPRMTLTGHKGLIAYLAFSPDGRTLATSAEDKLSRLWDVATGQLVATLAPDRSPHFSFSPDGRTLATWSYEKTIRLWDARTGTLKAPLVVKKGFISSLAFSPDSRMVITGSLGELVARLWDVETGQLTATLPHEKECSYCGTGVDVAFSPDGRTIATSSFRRAYLWDAAAKKLKMTLIDERYNRTVRVISHGKSEELVQTISHGQTIYRMAFSPDGRTLATGSRDFWAKLWDVSTG